MYKIYICAVELLSSRNSLWSFSFSLSRTVRDRCIIFMELHDNHIRIYRSILQVLQSLSRDNHGIFISLVLFETWLCCVSNLQFFCPWEPALLLRLVPKDSLKPVSLVLSPRPRTLVRRKQKKKKSRLHPLCPPAQEQSSAPPPTSAAGPEWHSRKIAVCTPSVWTLSMLSCLQVNLSWGICHGSSCFCI